MFEGRDDAGRPADASAKLPVDEAMPLEPESTMSPEVEAFGAGSAAADSLTAAATDDYKDRWLRAEADMQYVRRRAARDRDEAIAATESRFLLDLIELLDDLERALAAFSPEQKDSPWAQGVALTAQRMRDTLARWNVVAVETVGRPFDPNVHEALLEIDAPDGAAPGTIVNEALKGYRRGERTLRAARVVVARQRTDA